jgi:uncharacterized protein (DUF697 family)/tellurite resistance protein
MHDQERRGILTLCLMAAFADGERSEEEREHLRQVARHLGEAAGPDLFQRVLQRQVTVRDAARVLTTTEARALAYEMAVCVCDADGRLNEQERSFLREVQQALNVGEAPAATTQREAEALIVDSLEDLPGPAGATGSTADAPTGMSTPAPGAARKEPGGAPAPAAAASGVIDSMVLKYAILNGALELLPQPIATMAIIPLQMKMVYRIGGVYGYALDRGHVKEFLSVVGVGMTVQVVESFARRLLTGVGKKVLGKIGGRVADAAAGSAFSFTSTYALGQVAKQYYAGGRTLGAVDLKSLFSKAMSQAQSIYPQYADQMRSQAASLNISQLLPLIRAQM